MVENQIFCKKLAECGGSVNVSLTKFKATGTHAKTRTCSATLLVHLRVPLHWDLHLCCEVLLLMSSEALSRFADLQDSLTLRAPNAFASLGGSASVPPGEAGGA